MKFFNISLLLVLLIGTSCSDSSEESPIDYEQMEAEYAVLENEKQAIETLAKSIACTDEGVCSFIPFGSKPCGGPWTYLAYNSELNEEVFLLRVELYNLSEQAFNIKWSVVSDCATPSPPIGVTCVDGVCTAIYQ